MNEKFKENFRYLVDRIQTSSTNYWYELSEIEILEISETAMKIKMNYNTFWFLNEWEINIIEELQPKELHDFTKEQILEILKSYNKYMNILIDDNKLKKVITKLY